MKFRIVLEFDPEAGSFSAVCPELPGCASAASRMRTNLLWLVDQGKSSVNLRMSESHP